MCLYVYAVFVRVQCVYVCAVFVYVHVCAIFCGHSVCVYVRMCLLSLSVYGVRMCVLCLCVCVCACAPSHAMCIRGGKKIASGNECSSSSMGSGGGTPVIRVR